MKSKNIEISLLLDLDESELQSFFETNLNYCNDSNLNPIFPYKVNYSGNNLVTFCFYDLPVVSLWAYKEGAYKAFYIVLRNNNNISTIISQKFGNEYARGRVQVKDKLPISTFTYW